MPCDSNYDNKLFEFLTSKKQILNCQIYFIKKSYSVQLFKLTLLFISSNIYSLLLTLCSITSNFYFFSVNFNAFHITKLKKKITNVSFKFGNFTYFLRVKIELIQLISMSAWNNIYKNNEITSSYCRYKFLYTQNNYIKQFLWIKEFCTSFELSLLSLLTTENFFIWVESIINK